MHSQSQSWNKNTLAKGFEVLVEKKYLVGEEISEPQLAHNGECHVVEKLHTWANTVFFPKIFMCECSSVTQVGVEKILYIM